MRRREQQALAVGIEIPARRAPRPGADASHVGAIHLHREDLIAREIGRLRLLKDQSRTVRREVRLGVFATVRELLDVRQSGFAGVVGGGSPGTEVPAYMRAVRGAERSFGQKRDRDK